MHDSDINRWIGASNVSTLVIGAIILSLTGLLLLLSTGYENPFWYNLFDSNIALLFLGYIAVITLVITGPFYAWLT